jgi:starch phosphorylase
VQHPVGFGGHTEQTTDAEGRLHVRWVPGGVVNGVPYDTPVLGYETPNKFDLSAFQHGDYWRAVEDKVRSENISKVLYPNDEGMAGKQLRLQQEYFFVSCALQDCIRILLQKATIREFADKFAIQLNDTHPTLAVPELMRLLMDGHGLGWDEAWAITAKSFGYTNHTLMPEALERWPLPLFGKLLPRHLEIVYEINRRFLDQVRERFPGDDARVTRMSLIDEHGDKFVRMAHVATVGSHTINGVAALHSRLLRETVLHDFAEMYPERFTNVTNGVTPRRFIALSNPRLARLLDETLGVGWLKDLDRLADLRKHADDAGFRDRFRAVKHANKAELAAWLRAGQEVTVDASTLFDAQCKRIHEYKRQHLAVLHIAALYARLLRGEAVTPRTFLFAGKAAPGYAMAKLMIRLIHGVAGTLAADPKARDVLRVVFVPDFNVKNAQRIYPAVDLSEQISTAGFEASGTGNMKFAMNGALTIGTLDGANVEIRDAVGAEDFFLFGMTADEVSALRKRGYDPGKVAASDSELGEALDGIGHGRFSPGEAGLFEPLVRSLLRDDPFFVLADFRAYVNEQERVSRAWASPEAWTRSAVRNVAGMGNFSSDRSIREYAENIWKVPPVVIPQPNEHG